QAEDGIRDDLVTGVQTCALPISLPSAASTAYSSALDMCEQVVLPVARRVLEHLGKEPLECGADVGTRAHARRKQVVTRHGEIFEIGRASCRERVSGAGVGVAVSR